MEDPVVGQKLEQKQYELMAYMQQKFGGGGGMGGMPGGPGMQQPGVGGMYWWVLMQQLQ